MVQNDKTQLLNKDALTVGIKHKCNVFYYPSIDSTNTQAKRLLKEKNKAPFLVVASEQTAGRGRQGKSFYSPKNTGIYLSLVIPEKIGDDIVGTTTAASVSVCKAIEKLTDKRPEIKWVNDVYLYGKKVCGILCEAEFDGSDKTDVIIGIGVNITTSIFPGGIENAGNLNEDISKEALVSEITNELFDICSKPFSDFIPYYRSRSMVIGKKITFIENGISTRATAIEIDNKGGLVVKTEDGKIKTLSTGEITVRED